MLGKASEIKTALCEAFQKYDPETKKNVWVSLEQDIANKLASFGNADVIDIKFSSAGTHEDIQISALIIYKEGVES